MLSRRTLLGGAATAAATVLAGCGAGSRGAPDSQTMTGLELDTPAFDDGGTVPTKHTCDGQDVSPPLELNAPEEASALALLVDDPDAPGGTFYHWLLWNLPPDTPELPQGVPGEEAVLDGARQGENDFGEVGYRGPCPPEGDGPHTYRFTLHALDAPLDVEAGAAADPVLAAVDDASLGVARITADFER